MDFQLNPVLILMHFQSLFQESTEHCPTSSQSSTNLSARSSIAWRRFRFVAHLISCSAMPNEMILNFRTRNALPARRLRRSRRICLHKESTLAKRSPTYSTRATKTFSSKHLLAYLINDAKTEVFIIVIINFLFPADKEFWNSILSRWFD